MESQVEDDSREDLPNTDEDIKGEASSVDNTEVTPVDFE